MSEEKMIDEHVKIMRKEMNMMNEVENKMSDMKYVSTPTMMTDREYFTEKLTKIESRLTELEEASEEEVSEELALFMRIVERGMQEELIISGDEEGEGDEDE